MQENESQLIDRLRESDGEAFRRLFEKYQPVLFRSVLFTLRDADMAHDVVQEAFVRVWKNRSSLQPSLPLLAYLFRISRNLVLDVARRQAVRRKLETEIPAALHPSAEDLVETLHLSMLEERVSEVVRAKLPPKCREVFLLSRMEEMSNAEVGRELGISVKTVENQITKATKILRRELRRYL